MKLTMQNRLAHWFNNIFPIWLWEKFRYSFVFLQHNLMYNSLNSDDEQAATQINQFELHASYYQ